MSIRSNVDAREFDQRVAFERRVETATGTGGTTVTWTRLGGSPTATYWAKVDGAKASGEPYIADGIRSPADYTFWIRADVFTRLGLVLTDRIVWKGENFDISDMPDQQLRGRKIALIAQRGLNDG
jgi:head-tail adaptor